MEFDKKCCPILDVDGVIAGGKQFDLDITLPEDNRNVIYGVIKDCYKEPICNAVVKLIEVCGDERKPVSHTFTDKEGEFVFGPLCPDKFYEINFWVDRVKHIKVCAKCEHEGKCLKGEKMDKCDCFSKDDKKDECKKEEKKDDYKCEKVFEDVLDDLLITEVKEEKKECKKYYR